MRHTPVNVCDFTGTRILSGEKPGIDLDAVLNKIKTGMKSAPKHKQESMNRCLVEIGTHFPELTQHCIAIGEHLGKLDNTPVPKGCVSSYAPEWIAAVINRNK